MARNPLFLSQAVCTVIFDGQIVEGFAPGDAIRVIPSGEGSNVDVGLDVAVTTFTTDRSGEFEMDLMPTSAFLDTVNRLWSAQETAAARLLNVSVLTSANETVRLEGVSIASPGDMSTGGKTATPRTVKCKVQRVRMPQ